MAGRVNTRFVIILAVVIVVVVAGIGGVAYYAMRRDPGRYIAQAEALMSEDNYRDAVRQLGRAFGREKDNAAKVHLLMRMAETYQQITPEDATEAQEIFANVQNCWRRATDLDPTFLPASEKLLELYYRQARMFGSLGQWSQLYSIADNLLKFAPDHELARRYRGIAQIAQIEQRGLGATARNQAREDLTAAVEADPNDADATFYLSRLDLLDAEEAESTNRFDLAEELRNTARQRVNQFAAARPEDPEALLNRFRLLLRLGVGQQDEVAVDEARDVLTRLEQRLLKSDIPQPTLEVASRVADLDRLPSTADANTDLSGMERAERLLKHVVSNHPDDIRALVALGDIKVRQREMQAAMDYFQRARKDRNIPVSTEAFSITRYQIVATQKLADVHLVRREMSADDPNQQKGDLDRAHELIDDLARRAGERSGLALWMRGKLALVEGRPLEAVKKLEQAIAQYEGNNPQILLLLSMAYRQTGQTGAAADALTRLVNTPRGANMLQPNLQLAELRMGNNDYIGAERLVDRILQADPDNRQARLMKSRLELRRAADTGDVTRQEIVRQAMAKLQPLAEEGDRGAVLQLARLLRSVDRVDEARALLNDYHADHRDDIAVIQERVRLEQGEGNTETAAAIVEAAVERQPDNTILQLLLTAIRDQDSLSDELERIISEQEDPVNRALSYWRFYRRAGEAEKAEAALQQAIAAAPDNQRILEIRFDRAVADDDWAVAEKIVERAKRMNDGEGVDYAGGAFWEGRLQMARNNYAQAAATLERGLSEMPSNSQAHLMLSRCRFILGDLNGAERALQRSIELKPNNATAWRQLHEIHSRRQNHEQALDDLRRAMALEPEDGTLYMQYIDYLGQYGDRNQAIESRERIAQARPDAHANRRDLAQLYLQTNQPDKAHDELEALLAADPNNLSNVAAMAVYHAQTGEFDTGRAMLEQFFNQMPDGPDANAWLVMARYLRTGNAGDAALEAYRKAVAMDDGDEQRARREMADWLFGRGRFDLAAAEYEQIFEAVRDEPDDRLLVWRRYVETLLNAGNLDRASRQLDQLLAKHPSDAQALMIQGTICRRRLNEDNLSEARREQLTEKAEAAFDQAVLHAPDSAMPYFQRAAFRFNRDGDLVQQMVRDDLRRVIELDPTFVPARELLVQWYEQQGDVDSAVDELRRFVVDIPNSRAARNRLAQLYMRQERFTELENLLIDSLRAIPEAEPDWRVLWSQMHQVQGRMAEARREMAQAYELDRSAGRAGQYADLLVRTGQHEQALEVLNDWPDALTRSAPLYALRARALAGMGQRDAAITAFGRALDMAGSEIAQVNAVQMQMRTALPSSTVVEILKPRAANDPSGVIGLLLAREQIMAGQTDQALAELRKLEGRFTAGSEVETERQRMLARSYYDAGDFARARAAYERVLEQAPRDLMALNNLAYLLANDLDQPDAAMSLAERALRVAGDNPNQRANILDTVGWVHFTNNNMREAADALERSIRLNPMAISHLHLAKVYIAQDRPIAAREQLIAAAQLAEDAGDQDVVAEAQQLLQTLDSTAANLER